MNILSRTLWFLLLVVAAICIVTTQSPAQSGSPYHTSQSVSGTIRIWGDAQMAASYSGLGFLLYTEIHEKYIWDNDPRPHNAFLTVLYKMGLIGFLPLLALLCFFFLRAFKTLQRHRGNRHALFLQILVIGEVTFCLYGLANIVLESPFLASLFWGGMGVGLRAIDNFNTGPPSQS